MADATGLPPLRAVIREFGLGARKSLGQHFLLDTNLTRRIAQAAGPLDGVAVFEIGPGPGGLTRALLETPARQVVAVELDRRCVEALALLQAAYPGRLTVVEGDALALDLPFEAARLGVEPPYRIVANLPYNISTALLLRWLDRATDYDDMVLMFQREVADRLLAAPGGKSYGRLSVMAQWRCAVERLFNIPAAAFTPPPKVMSSVIRLTPRSTPLAPADPALLERVCASAFGQRRKMLRQSLKSLGTDPLRLLEAAGIEPTARAETVSVEGFCALARALENRD